MSESEFNIVFIEHNLLSQHQFDFREYIRETIVQFIRQQFKNHLYFYKR